MGIKVQAGENGADLRSNLGIRMQIAPNMERVIPEFLLADAQLQGCIPSSMIEERLKKDQGGGSDPVGNDDPGESTDKLRAVLSDMITENNPEDFTANGPKVAAVNKRLGYNVKSADINPIYEAMTDDDGSE